MAEAEAVVAGQLRAVGANEAFARKGHQVAARSRPGTRGKQLLDRAAVERDPLD